MSNNNILATSQFNGILPVKSGMSTQELFEIVKSLSILDNDQEINLTPIAKFFGKRIDSWKKSSIEIIEELRITQKTDSVIIRIKQGFDGNQGTYTSSPDLFLEFLRYCSPKIAIKMTAIVRELFQTGKVELQKPNSKMDLILQFQEALNMAVIEIKEKDELLKLQAPLVDLADTYLLNGSNMNLSTCAKTLKIKVTELTALLYSQGLIFDQRGNKVPYSNYVDWFFCKPFVAQNGHTGHQLLITPLGLTKLASKLKITIDNETKMLN